MMATFNAGLARPDFPWITIGRGSAAQTGTVTEDLVDQGFKNTDVAHGAGLGLDAEIVERNPADKGFIPQPKRWIVEQTYSTLKLYRPPGPRLRTQPGQIRITSVLGDG